MLKCYSALKKAEEEMFQPFQKKKKRILKIFFLRNVLIVLIYLNTNTF